MSGQVAASAPRDRVGAQIDWAPYLAGIGIGILSWIVFAVVATPIGVTTAGSQVAGGFAGLFVGQEAVQANSYWARNPLRVDYGTLFLVGILLGAFASALASRRFRLEAVPAVWRERFGPSIGKRYVAAFVGGVAAMYGARLAGGCTSGNGISQGLQLAVVGWTFLAAMFASGLLTARLLYRR
ncbi:MAG TPA: YeeE/YedE thiosulfate transporter family protein [Burkholderiaceae bacterium]|nr:YeeE/YedE thiosulfate transporter family protein [Burkholderiaceae bacterium]